VAFASLFAIFEGNKSKNRHNSSAKARKVWFSFINCFLFDLDTARFAAQAAFFPKRQNLLQIVYVILP
jgi:hypothetical protein